ncbi:DEAD/DEAH box helicase [Sorangium sp. So ce281]|uniref:DEAD/DEAH box helicase n=1 Tax=unclassified Sorangium TaxID=2621164 RepID=UPI003F60B162
MDAEERAQVEQVLARISREDWDGFLASDEGARVGERLDAVRAALRGSGNLSPGAPSRPIAEVVDLLGHRLLSDGATGPWLREKILQNLSTTRYKKLEALYREVGGRRAAPLHGNMTQQGAGSRVMAGYWHQGSTWARRFCEITGLPELLAKCRSNPLPDDEEVVPVEPLPPLHDFQIEVYAAIRKMLLGGTGETALLSLPTGAGKTRVAVEAICDHLAEERQRCNVVLWIAQTDELQRQAWECFRQVWQVPPQRVGKIIRRTPPLSIVRLWGGRDPDSIEIGDEPTVLVAGIDQLASWVDNMPDFFESFPTRRLACAVVDEAHSLITHTQREVLVALGLCAKREWRALQGAAPVIGLSATPWRSDDEESATLQRYFQKQLLRPDSLGQKPIQALQRRGILAQVNAERLRVEGTRAMTDAQLRRFEQFRDLPGDYVAQLGLEHDRNARILKRLGRLPKRRHALVFACSVAHAEVLAVALNRALDDDCAAVVTGQTPRAERAAVIERFRDGDGLRFLCNVGVLTTGFDAPRADVVCITRPTTSALRYEQMVGRGLRGPENGGTAECLVVDVQDDGLPEGIQSYSRVAHLWDG